MFALPAVAAESGTIGDCTWELDDEGTLTIAPVEGTNGVMKNFTSSSSVPWYEHRDDIKKAVIAEGVSAQDTAYMFYDCTSLESVEGLDDLDTSRTTSMKYMFYYCQSLTELGVSSWDTSNVTNMQGLFYYCNSLETLDVSGWKTSKVANMHSLFSICSSLKSLDVSDWDTSKVTDMGFIFSNCRSLAELDVSDWDTLNVAKMNSMFYGCSSLASLDTSSWDTSNANCMDSIFYSCDSLESLDVSDWKTSKVTDMSLMFCGCDSLAELDVSDWDTSNVVDMHGLFAHCDSLESLDVSSWKTPKVDIMNSMFSGCQSLTELDLSSWDTASLDKAEEMLAGCLSLKVISIGGAFLLDEEMSLEMPSAPCEWRAVGEGTVSNPQGDYYSSVEELIEAHNAGNKTETYVVVMAENPADHADYIVSVDDGAQEYEVELNSWSSVTWKLSDDSVGSLSGSSIGSYVTSTGSKIVASIKFIPLAPGYTELYAYVGGSLKAKAFIVVAPSTRIDISDAATILISPDEYEYTGEAIAPALKVRLDGVELTPGVDYEVSFSGNVNAGTATASVRGIGDYRGEASASFAIVPAKVEVPSASEGLVYTGAERVGVEGGVGYSISGTSSAVNARDYEAVASLRSANYTWADGSTDAKSIKWAIVPALISSVEGLSVSDQPCTGEALCPALSLSYNGAALTEGVDYEVSYADNVKPGVATATVKGIGNFQGNVQLTFKIKRQPSISEASYRPVDAQIYTGLPSEPSVSLFIGDSALVEGVDYEVTYENNVEIGQAAAIARGINGYSGEKTIPFDIRAVAFYEETKCTPTNEIGALAKFELTSPSSLYLGFSGDESSFRGLYVLDESGERVWGGYGGASDASRWETYEEGSTGEFEPGTYTLCVRGNGRYDSDCSFVVSPKKVERLWGNEANETAAEISKEAFNSSEWVVLARDDDFADAMSATGLAGALDAPIILTDRYGLSEAAYDEIRRLDARNVYIIGGPGAMPGDFEREFMGLGFNLIERVYGNESWDTSVKCAEKIIEHGGNADTSIVAMSLNFQDALSISSFAYKYKVPIYLQTQSGERPLPDEAIEMIEEAGGRIYVPGGPGAVRESTVEGVFGEERVTRIYGDDGYDTSNAIAIYMMSQGLLHPEYTCIACGAQAPKGTDALAGAALAGKRGGIMLLVNGNERIEEANTVTIQGVYSRSFMEHYGSYMAEAYVLGGSYVMPDSVVKTIADKMQTFLY